VGAVLLGVIIAASFGSGDFVGGRASSTTPTISVLAVSQACSVVGAAILVLFVASHPAPHDIVYGALAGAVNVVGLGLLYRGLARYSAGVIAPITAVVGALVPVAWGLAHGERPSVLALVGVALAVGAGGLIALEPGASAARGLALGVGQAVGAGAALGSSLVLYAETASRSGQVPVLAGRLAAFVLAGVACSWLRRTRDVPLPHGSARGLAVGAGVFDVAATALLVVAVRRDLLSLVAPVVSLAPGMTVILAWRVDHERLRRAQRVGLLVALVGLALVATG
jgi:drug/metabolite transporter (DMT)-like permease